MYKNEWTVIKQLADLFERKNIRYHFDASTSVFVHGIEFEMDDIDIVFMWNEESKLRESIIEYGLTETKYIEEIDLKYFWAEINGLKLHCLFYGRDNVIIDEKEFNANTEEIIVDEQKIMTQTLGFYLKYSKDKNNLKPRIHSFLEEKESKNAN